MHEQPDLIELCMTHSISRKFLGVFGTYDYLIVIVALLHPGKLIFTAFFAAQRCLRHLCIKAGNYLFTYFFIYCSQK